MDIVRVLIRFNSPQRAVLDVFWGDVVRSVELEQSSVTSDHDKVVQRAGRIVTGRRFQGRFEKREFAV
jgi:hypothetical protein